MTKILFFTLVTVLFFSSCTKEDAATADLSDQYVGNYVTFETRTYTNPYTSQTTIDTASAYAVTINKTGTTTVDLINFGNCGTNTINANASDQSIVPTAPVCHRNVLITKITEGFSYTYENDQYVADPVQSWNNSYVTATVSGKATKQ